MNIQDLTDLTNKKIRFDHHAENHRQNIIKDETVTVDFFERWNSKRNMVELLLTEAVIVSKTIENKLE